MRRQEQTFCRSRIEIYVPYPGETDALSAEDSYVVKTYNMFTMWFGDTEIKIRYCRYEKGGFETVYIVCSYCTTEKLKTHVASAISFARELAKELGRDRIIMVINNNQFDVKPL